MSHKVSCATGLAPNKYYNDGLYEVLYEFLGDTKMDNLMNRVIIPAYEVNKNETVVFDS